MRATHEDRTTIAAELARILHDVPAAQEWMPLVVDDAVRKWEDITGRLRRRDWPTFMLYRLWAGAQLGNPHLSILQQFADTYTLAVEDGGDLPDSARAAAWAAHARRLAAAGS